MSRTTRKSPKENLIAQLNASIARISKERDELSATIEQAQELLDSCERADEALREAVDALSENT